LEVRRGRAGARAARCELAAVIPPPRAPDRRPTGRIDLTRLPGCDLVDGGGLWQRQRIDLTIVMARRVDGCTRARGGARQSLHSPARVPNENVRGPDLTSQMNRLHPARCPVRSDASDGSTAERRLTLDLDVLMRGCLERLRQMAVCLQELPEPPSRVRHASARCWELQSRVRHASARCWELQSRVRHDTGRCLEVHSGLTPAHAPRTRLSSHWRDLSSVWNELTTLLGHLSSMCGRLTSVMRLSAPALASSDFGIVVVRPSPVASCVRVWVARPRPVVL
jgi:hypothetical protein